MARRLEQVPAVLPGDGGETGTVPSRENAPPIYFSSSPSYLTRSSIVLTTRASRSCLCQRDDVPKVLQRLYFSLPVGFEIVLDLYSCSST
jgi:hypothetical protein